MHTKRIILGLLTLLSSSVFAQILEVEAEKPLEQSFEEKQIFSLSLENREGPCEIRESTTDKVEVRATTKHKDKFSVALEGFGTEEASIKVLYPPKTATNDIIVLGPGDALPPARSVRLEIAIPRRLLKNLTITTQNGEISIWGRFAGSLAEGRVLAATTRNGDIMTNGLTATGGGKLQATNGTLRVIDFEGPLSLTTSNGDIVAENGLGTISAKVNNGKIRVVNQQGTLVEAKANNGSIFFENPKASLLRLPSVGFRRKLPRKPHHLQW